VRRPEGSLRPLPNAIIAREIHPELGKSWPADGLGAIEVVAVQLPDPRELPDGSVVVVHEAARPPVTWRGRVGETLRFWQSRKTAHRAVRCTALLALGYRDVGLAIDPRTHAEVVWGIAVTSGRSSSAA
jgi:hypothetical protein